MVGSVISELRSRPIRLRSMRSRMAAMSSGRLSRSVSWMAGAMSPPPRRAIGDADMDRRARLEPALAKEAVEDRRAAQRKRGSLDQESTQQDAPLRRQGRIGLGEPGQRRRQVDVGRQIVVRDLALRPGHRRRDRLAHFGKVEAGLASCRRPRRRGRAHRR